MPDYELVVAGRKYDISLPPPPFDVQGEIGGYAVRLVGYEDGSIEGAMQALHRTSPLERNAFSDLQEALDPRRLPLIGRFL